MEIRQIVRKFFIYGHGNVDDTWVTKDFKILYPQVIYNAFEEMRQTHSRTGNQCDHLSTVTVFQLQLVEVQRGYLQSTLKSVD